MRHNPRLPRVERDEVVELQEDENSHLWAVSYSDFLMALLSFFILFFSIETPKRDQIIYNLAEQFSGQNQGAGGFGASGSDKGEEGKNHRLPANFAESLKSYNVNVDKDHEALIINFPDDLFKAGRHTMLSEKTDLITNCLKMLKPYEGKITLYFEGHTDDKPLRVHKNDIVTDNFVLSSLRASSALGLAKKMGFSEKYMFTQANSSNLRNSRSLSIRIEPRKDVL